MTHGPDQLAQVQLPAELVAQLEQLIEQLSESSLARFANVDREVVLRIALARGLEVLAEDLEPTVH